MPHNSLMLLIVFFLGISAIYCSWRAKVYLTKYCDICFLFGVFAQHQAGCLKPHGLQCTCGLDTIKDDIENRVRRLKGK